MTKLTTRLRNALKAFQDDRPYYGPGYDYHEPFRFTGWGWNRGHWGTSIDYAREVGPLENSSLVMAVVNITGVQLSEATPVVMIPDTNNGFEQPEFGHPCSSLIRRPNNHNIWADYCHALSLSWWIDGNVYFKKVRSITGEVVELWYLPHFLVEERWPDDGRTPEVPLDRKLDPTLSHYQYTVPGKEPVLYPAEDMIHIKRGVNLANPRKGVGAFDSVIKEIYGDEKAALFAATIMKNMGIVVPLLSPRDKDITISETDALAIKEKWIQQTTGDNSGVPLINPISLEATKFAFSPQELDLKELRMVPESRIAAVTNFPAPVLQFLVGLVNGTSYASYEQARQHSYESVIIPIQNHLAEDFTWQLLPEFEKSKGARVWFDTSTVRVLQEDQDALVKRAVAGFTGRVLKRSDAREMLGLETGPEDDVYDTQTPVSSQMTPAKFADIDQMLENLEEQMKNFCAIEDRKQLK